MMDQQACPKGIGMEECVPQPGKYVWNDGGSLTVECDCERCGRGITADYRVWGTTDFDYGGVDADADNSHCKSNGHDEDWMDYVDADMNSDGNVVRIMECPDCGARMMDDFQLREVSPAA